MRACTAGALSAALVLLALALCAPAVPLPSSLECSERGATPAGDSHCVVRARRRKGGERAEECACNIKTTASSTATVISCNRFSPAAIPSLPLSLLFSICPLLTTSLRPL